MDNQNLDREASFVRYSKIPWLLLAIEFFYPVVLTYIAIRNFPCIGFCPGVTQSGPDIPVLISMIAYVVLLIWGSVYSVKEIIKYRRNTPFRFYLLFIMPVIVFVLGYLVFNKM